MGKKAVTEKDSVATERKKLHWERLFGVMNDTNPLLLTALKDCLIGNNLNPIELVKFIDKYEDEVLGVDTDAEDIEIRSIEEDEDDD
jgi:hypothetical protein